MSAHLAALPLLSMQFSLSAILSSREKVSPRSENELINSPVPYVFLSSPTSLLLSVCLLPSLSQSPFIHSILSSLCLCAPLHLTQAHLSPALGLPIPPTRSPSPSFHSSLHFPPQIFHLPSCCLSFLTSSLLVAASSLFLSSARVLGSSRYFQSCSTPLSLLSAFFFCAFHPHHLLYHYASLLFCNPHFLNCFFTLLLCSYAGQALTYNWGQRLICLLLFPS